MNIRAIGAISVLAVLSAGVVWKERSKTSAADSDGTTRGATDPTWSPDGKQLAFTLNGSIWSVDAGGGVARQVTSGAGYHAHPAWSPTGDGIAFISGAPPAGPLPNIAGKLMVVNPEGGAEREVSLPNPTAGTPTWSPDGKRIAVALAVPNSGALLHEVTLATNEVRALQSRPQRSPTGGWVAASWNPKREEIFYAGQHFAGVQTGAHFLSPPQIWSIPSTRAPVVVQLPLTSYRLTDIVQPHSVAALPDGSGVIYSAVVVNGKGDRELYRVPREGGKPVAITNTPRDEFSPAVSPDGKLIAHSSNHLGNLDLFTMPVTGGEKKHVRITELKFRQAQAKLRVRTVDENGQPTAARLYVRASDGKAYSPQGSPIWYYGLEPDAAREGFFLTTGDDTFDLPAGTVELTAIKGIEYRLEDRKVDAAASDTTEITIPLRRWTNWTQKGWYTGEDHFHANYNGSYYERPAQSQRWLQATDLNAANMIVANSEGAFIHDKEFFTGNVSTASTPRYLLYWGQEYRNSDPLGHMAFLNIKKQVPPSFTSVIGSSASIDYPLNTQAAMAARQQGGVVVYVHPFSFNFRDPLDLNLSAKEIPLTAALGALDGIDVLPFGQAYEIWYRLLNCGFRVTPGGGTDVFTNWRGINNIPGQSRQYVDVGQPFTWDRWVSRFREGRVFVTNGPLLTFTANGQGPGAVVPIQAAEPYRVRLTVEVESSLPVDKLEILRNGEVIETRPLRANTSTVQRVELEVTSSGSAWFAARVWGPRAKGLATEMARAHSGAVYFDVAGKRVLVREDAELMIRWLNALWAYLEERNNFGPAANRVQARALFDRGLAYYRNLLAVR